MNIFDSLKVQVFDVVTDQMGYNATWLSSESGSSVLAARVGYKDPSEKQELSGFGDWEPDVPYMEYRAGFFTDLKSRVDSGSFETVAIEGKGNFSIRKVITRYDGDTFLATMEKL